MTPAITILESVHNNRPIDGVEKVQYLMSRFHTILNPVIEVKNLSVIYYRTILYVLELFYIFVK